METNWKKNTALFIIGQTITLFGSSVVQYAILWHITLKTQSGIMMTLITIVGFLPIFIISPFGGVWAVVNAPHCPITCPNRQLPRALNDICADVNIE
jgi:uncharacterized membrane protein